MGSQHNLKQVRSSQGSLKFQKSVTFKAGLLADWEHEAYFGPLMSMEEVCLRSILYQYFFTMKIVIILCATSHLQLTSDRFLLLLRLLWEYKWLIL